MKLQGKARYKLFIFLLAISIFAIGMLSWKSKSPKDKSLAAHPKKPNIIIIPNIDQMAKNRMKLMAVSPRNNSNPNNPCHQTVCVITL